MARDMQPKLKPARKAEQGKLLFPDDMLDRKYRNMKRNCSALSSPQMVAMGKYPDNSSD